MNHQKEAGDDWITLNVRYCYRDVESQRTFYNSDVNLAARIGQNTITNKFCKSNAS